MESQDSMCQSVHSGTADLICVGFCAVLAASVLKKRQHVAEKRLLFRRIPLFHDPDENLRWTDMQRVHNSQRALTSGVESEHLNLFPGPKTMRKHRNRPPYATPMSTSLRLGRFESARYGCRFAPLHTGHNTSTTPKTLRPLLLCCREPNPREPGSRRWHERSAPLGSGPPALRPLALWQRSTGAAARDPCNTCCSGHLTPPWRRRCGRSHHASSPRLPGPPALLPLRLLLWRQRHLMLGASPGAAGG